MDLIGLFSWHASLIPAWSEEVGEWVGSAHLIIVGMCRNLSSTNPVSLWAHQPAHVVYTECLPAIWVLRRNGTNKENNGGCRQGKESFT